MVKSIDRLSDIASRIDHLESQAEWIARETINADNSVSHTASLIMALADDLREKICHLVKDLERGAEESELH